MALKEKLETELFIALRNKNDVRKRTIRMVISNIKLVEIEQKSLLDDSGIVASLYKEIKIRKETIEEAKKGNRDSIIKETEEEISILKEFLPLGLNEKELIELSKKVIQELNAREIKDMGNVMKVMMERVKGQSPNDAISRVVKELLQNK
jgi:uncharacterized protein YqeY